MLGLLKSLKKPQIQDIYYCFANRSERYWLGVLAVLVIISRWLGHMQYLYLSDSVRYALALDRYDVTLHQPHPPGYALYILFVKPFYWLIGDANLALIVVSIIFSVLALYTVFYLAKRIYGSKVAWVSVLLFITGSLVWFHGQVALNYITDAFFAALFGIYAYDSLKQSKESNLFKASLALAIGGGFRPTLVIFMLPLWLWIILRRRSVKLFLINSSIILAVTLAWLIPAVLLSGGIESFWNTVQSLIFNKSGLYSFSAVISGIEPMWKQLNMVVNNLLLNFGLALVFVVLWLISFAVPRLEDIKINLTNLSFWTLWILPPVLFYVLVIFTLSGYILIIIPALAIVIAKVIDVVVNSIIKVLPSKLPLKKSLLPTTLLSTIVIFIVGFNIYLYIVPDQKAVVEFRKPTHFTVDSMNRIWDELIPTIRGEFNPQGTIVGINKPYLTWGLSHFQYYLPQYQTYSRVLWGVYNPDNKSWSMSYTGKLTLIDTVDIYPTDTKMIIVGPDWSISSRSMKEVIIPNNLGKILYYDLTNLDIRKLVEKIGNVRFIGGDEDAKT